MSLLNKDELKYVSFVASFHVSLLSFNIVCNYAYICALLCLTSLLTGEICVRNWRGKKRDQGELCRSCAYYNAWDIVMLKKHLLKEWIDDR